MDWGGTSRTVQPDVWVKIYPENLTNSAFLPRCCNNGRMAIKQKQELAHPQQQDNLSFVLTFLEIIESQELLETKFWSFAVWTDYIENFIFQFFIFARVNCIFHKFF
jgi:hypothetical protein